MKYYAVWEGREFPDGTVVSLHTERENAEEKLDRKRVLSHRKWNWVAGRWQRTRILPEDEDYKERTQTIFLEVIHVNMDLVPSRLERIADLEKKMADIRGELILERIAESRATTTTSRETPAKRRKVVP